MNTLFIYDTPVSGQNFIGRKQDCTNLGNMILSGTNISIYEPAKTGKTSLIRESLFRLKSRGENIDSIEIPLLNIRSIQKFICRLGNSVLRHFTSIPDELEALMDKYLYETHFVFDKARYSEEGDILSLNWDLDKADIEAVLRLPYRIASDRNIGLVIVLDEFQNICMTEDEDMILKVMERVIEEETERIMEDDHENRGRFSWIFCGSMVNAMKHIFAERRFFYHVCSHYSISEIDEREITELIAKGYSSGGKVIEKDLILGLCKTFKNNIWHMCHLSAICDSLSRGYIVESTYNDALRIMLSTFDPCYRTIVNDLTTYQLHLLQAYIDGYKKFSTSEVIEKYGLNSSANVKRLKDALTKKEILTFNEDDEPYIMDSLFDYWLRNIYFAD